MPDSKDPQLISILSQRAKTSRQTHRTARRLAKKGEIPAALEYFGIAIENSFTVALANWRMQLGDPRSILIDVTAFQEEVLGLIRAQGLVEHYWSSFNLCRGALIQLLLLDTNRPPLLEHATPPVELIAEPQAHLLPRLMDWLLLKALETGLFTDEWDHLMDLMRPHKRLHHVVRTYQTYRMMIQAWQQGRGDDTVAALREAEALFARRTKVPYYAGGLDSCGGYELIPVVDYQLAAIIRVLEGFGGEDAPKLESIHRWRW